MVRHGVIGFVVAWGWLALAIPLRSAELVRLEVDPVELVAGREVAGEPGKSVQRGGFEYWFASDANRAAFERDPERYEIQLGGACARMGPLSGAGRVDLRAVHEGRIYLFASEACRKTFLENAERLLESDDPPLVGGDADREKRGRELLERAVEAVGGAQTIDKLRTYRQVMERTVNSGGVDYLVRTSLELAFPDQARQEQTWNGEYLSAQVKTGTRAYLDDGKNPIAMAKDQARAFERQLDRSLLIILRARNRPDFQALAMGSAEVAGAAIERVAVGFDGTKTILGIDPKTGRVLSLSYRGRGPNAFLGEMERRFSDFRETGGLTLPATVTVSFEGEPVTGGGGTFKAIEVNPEIAAAAFQPSGK